MNKKVIIQFDQFLSNKQYLEDIEKMTKSFENGLVFVPSGYHVIILDDCDRCIYSTENSRRELYKAIKTAENMSVDYTGMTEEEVTELDDAIEQIFAAARFLSGGVEDEQSR